MKGQLIGQNGEWFVMYDSNGELKKYPLCPESKIFYEDPNNAKELKENLEVNFDFIIKGEFCETKEIFIKNYFAKIRK